MIRAVSRRQVLGGASGATAAIFLPKTVWAKSRGPIKLGLSVPTSGVMSLEGREVARGFNMYMDAIGRVAEGRKIIVIQEDETTEVSTGVAKARKLLDRDKVNCLIGGALSSVIYGVIPLVVERKTPYLVAIGGGSEITRKDHRNPFTYRISYNIWAMTYPFGKYVAENVTKRVHVFCPDYVAGREYAEAFKAGLLAGGGKVTGETYAPISTPDFVPYLTNIAESRPEAIFGFWPSISGERYFTAVAQLQLGSKIKQLAIGYGVSQDTLPVIKNAAVGAISISPWNASLNYPENKMLIAAYQKKYNRMPSYLAVWGWDAGHAVAEAIKRVDGEVEDRKGFAAAFGGLSFEGPRGPIEIDGTTHDIIQNMYIQKTVPGNPIPTNEVIATLKHVKDPFPQR